VADVALPGNCSKIPATLADPVYSDTCWPFASLTLSWTMTGATIGSGTGTVTNLPFNVGVTTVTYTVTDPNSNSDNCSFTVTIHDVTPPSVGIAGCEDVTDITGANSCTHTPGTINDPVYSDTCWPVDSLTITWAMTGATTGSGTGSVKGQSFNAGVTTVTYTVTDPDGNQATCDFTVTIVPFNPPQFTAGCPPDIIAAPNDPGLCSADLTIPVPTVDDPCNIGFTITNDRTGTGNASGIYPVGTTEVIWTITPTVGDPTYCTQTITVTDTELPVITTCPVDRSFADCDAASLTGPAFSTTTANSTYAEFADATNQGVATDNCGIVSVTYIDVECRNLPDYDYTYMDGV
jgi:large repetitive protein